MKSDEIIYDRFSHTFLRRTTNDDIWGNNDIMNDVGSAHSTASQSVTFTWRIHQTMHTHANSSLYYASFFLFFFIIIIMKYGWRYGRIYRKREEEEKKKQNKCHKNISTERGEDRAPNVERPKYVMKIK